MTTRRHFLGTLGKALGAGGLLLPWSGKGALALPADLGKAAQLPVTPAPLPFSADALNLREIRRELHALHPVTGDYPGPWYHMMTQTYRPVEKRLASRPVRSWTDCVELAEAIYTFLDKEDRDAGPTTAKLLAQPDRRQGYGSISDREYALVVALVEGLIALGGGDKFDPTIHAA